MGNQTVQVGRSIVAVRPPSVQRPGTAAPVQRTEHYTLHLGDTRAENLAGTSLAGQDQGWAEAQLEVLLQQHANQSMEATAPQRIEAMPGAGAPLALAFHEAAQQSIPESSSTSNTGALRCVERAISVPARGWQGALEAPKGKPQRKSSRGGTSRPRSRARGRDNRDRSRGSREQYRK